MPFILPANTLSAGGYDVANSCIFDRASTDSMSKSMSDGSSIKGTFSAWIKVDGTGNEMNILSHFQDTSNVFSIATSGSSVYVVDYNSGYSLQLATNRIMRDPSAWFHLYVAIDRSQGTANNRNRIFINGVEETSFSNRTNYGQQTSGGHQDAISMNDGDCTMYLGGLGDGNQMFGGYLAEVVWLDGTASAVTNFGEFDEDSGIFKPIDVSGLSSSKGTNGFYLDFEDASNLGNDAFGGTDLTESNIASTNQTTDTCTNNFAVGNPLVQNDLPAFSNGNLTYTSGSNNYKTGLSTIGVSSGKWFMEVLFVSGSTAIIGVVDEADFSSLNGNTAGAGFTTNSVGYYKDGTKWIADSESSYGASYTANDTIGIALDLDSGTKTVTFYKDGASQGAINLPTTGTGTFFFAPGAYNSVLSANYGSPPFAISSGNTDANGYGNFEFTVPSGYYALNTKNLAEYG